MDMDLLDIKTRVEAIEDLPTLPVVVTQILQATKNVATNADDVGNLISADQSLTTKVLKLVNSPFYGFPQKIRTITHAIVILGFAKVKNIVLAASVFGMAKQPSNSTISLNKLWEHSLITGIACRQIAKHLNSSVDIEEMFVAGLLHDLGKVILICNLSDVCQQVGQVVQENNCLFYDAEKKLLNFNHEDIGAWLSRKWNLSPSLVSAIELHHNPLVVDERYKEIVYTVHVGDILSRAIGRGNGGDNKIPQLNNIVIEKLGLSISAIEQLMIEVLAEIDKAKDFFDLIYDQK